MSEPDEQSTDLCTYAVADGVATLSFNRPDNMNGMIGDMEVAYFQRLRQADADPDVRVIVLTGTGRGFCPGADLAHKAGEGQEPLPNQSIPTTTPLEIRKPMIAAINGACAGVGLAYALQCDIRIAAAGVKFTSAFAQRGLIGEYGMPWLINEVAGRAFAMDVMLSARIFLAEEAKEMGLVHQVVERDVFDEAVADYAAGLAANSSPASMATIKHQINTQPSMTGHEAMADSDVLMRQSLTGPDVGEGINSFLERRQVVFPPLGEGTTYRWMD
jgi:enoyl-CoA hydratase/carnithine racemase